MMKTTYKHPFMFYFTPSSKKKHEFPKTKRITLFENQKTHELPKTERITPYRKPKDTRYSKTERTTIFETLPPSLPIILQTQPINPFLIIPTNLIRFRLSFIRYHFRPFLIIQINFIDFLIRFLF